MTLHRVKWVSLALAFGMTSWCVAPARAALGGDAASVASDADALHGAIHTTPLQQYDIHEITADNGMRLREFQTRSGVVFAVVWSGPAMPDLQKLLGTSYQAYTTAVAAANHSGLKHPLRVATSDLVVESEGHMRAYSGRAYLPALIPAGMSAADLR
ncbi:MAG: hypothetical protein QOI88_2727 [Gammaproteobacteria bacterium]|jgi:hypothetical protein|nr:hypothetical protein [Gammaproteobacteria bacterium]